ncbi:CHAT domain-containing protein [Rhizoctonia solani]|nr:CHAT domain-containing protein [Rhizoctonia solani]
MKPKKAAELMHSARTGPVVAINVHYSRCDALVIQPRGTEIRCVPLPDLSCSQAINLHSQLDRLLRHQDLRERSSARRPDLSTQTDYAEANDFESVLSTLWSAVAKPVIEFLAYVVHPKVMPHITWCPTGPLSFLPLHAAGRYGPSPVKLADFVISSYTSTLSALIHAPSIAPGAHSRMLAICQEATPGISCLPGTSVELAFIEKHVKAPLHYTRIDNHRATTERILSEMKLSDWVHLACHATQDARRPTESGFFLHDGMLSPTKIIQGSFENKGVAFLSACQTATGDKNLPEEAVHLAAGMIFAGYPSVIATMWSVNDQDAPVVADRVYSQLIEDGTMNYRGAANTLHMAVNELRSSVGEREFGRWVPHTHIGV